MRETSIPDRVIAIDILRGFALYGILYAHVTIWYTGGALPKDIYVQFDDLASGIAMGIFGTFVLGKFFSVFAFLFGLSYYIQLKKNSNEEGNFTARYLLRLLVLGIIGLIHHIVWRGDILLIYALLGISLLLAHRLSNKIILILAFILILNIPNKFVDIITPNEISTNSSLPMEKEAQRYYEVVKYGSFKEVMYDNWKILSSKFNFQFTSGRLFMTLGFFLLGFYSGRKQWFQQPQISAPIFQKICRIAGVLCLLLIFTGGIFVATGVVSYPSMTYKPESKWFLEILFNLYNVSTSFFYITGVFLLLQKPVWKKMLSPLQYPGRMALTTYLMQTFFGLLIFYAFGLGLFERTSPGLNILIGLIIFTLQLIISRWWLSFFKQGPVEWLWRALTNFQFKPSINKQLSKG